MNKLTKQSLWALALAGSTAMPVMAESISWIYCGDKIDPIHEEKIAEWEAANEGWTIEPEVVGWAQCQDKATTLAAAGSPAGMAYVGSRTLKEFALNELIVPVPMSEDELASYYPTIPSTVTFDGQQWGVPIAFTSRAFFWNKDLFREAGLDPETPPKTWDEQQQMAETIKEKTGVAGIGVVAKTVDNTMHNFLNWVYSNGGEIIDADGNIVLDSPQNLAALEALKAITPFAEEGPTAYDQSEVRAIFLDGKMGMLQYNPGAINRVKGTDIDWGVTTLPVGPDAKGPGTTLISDSLAIFSGTGVEDKAIEFAKYITSPEIQTPFELSLGLTPLRPSAENDAFVEANPEWKPFIDGIEFGGPEPLFTDYKGFQNVMIEMVQSVVTGEAEPADALSKAAEELEEYK